jgi:diadenosine tetraphosphatase ApaH/serine/threonine PP2A family protein phosphatase
VFAIISDIHSNLEALQTVFGEIDRRGINRVFCLGDVVGYGASPKECLDMVAERVEVCICGNHDHAVFYEPYNFNVGAERAAFWTRGVFEEETNKAVRNRRWEFLGRLPVRHDYNGLLFVHGSPRRPVNEYLFAEDVYTNPAKITANFDRLEDHQMACFVGHTHVPGVFLDDPYFDPPMELPQAGRYEITNEEKAIINVGSVGQPRDRDTRASFVIVHEPDDEPEDNAEAPARGGLPKPEHDASSPPEAAENGDFRPVTVEFVRLQYDIEKAVKKILAVSELDDFLGHRLMDGR